MRPGAMRKAVVAALEDKKARDIAVFDVRKLTAMFDHVIIASADSTRQTKALARNVQDKLKELGAQVYGVEGEDTGEWILVDLGDIVVHVMQPAVRQYYNLEELWAAPKKTRAKKSAAAPPKEAQTT
jgi:ribosome-associated protein